ncbi:MAG: oligopeptide transport system permease protein [Chthoniobacter sp.]|jgi:oligopeptide transport system permease protein|nr:oligopeptide transport system permease protein [Chthoniobacter sp.]
MAAFILRRFASLLVVLLCVVAITFVLSRMAKGGPFTRERNLPASIEKRLLARYNLEGPLWEQFTVYLGVRRNVSGKFSGVLQGDLQPSTRYKDNTVNELIADSMPVSATLGLFAFMLATTGGIWLGTIAAMRHHTWLDATAMLGALALISIPTFVTGPVLVLFFALKLGWLPVGGWSFWSSMILPGVTLAGPYIAYIARLMRTSMLEVLGQDYVRTARAKGLKESKVVSRHVLKVAILPVVSFLGPLAANLLTGSIVVETIFNIPGAGGFFINSIQNRDTFLLCGITIVYCTLLVVLNLVVDVAYPWLDRRIKLYG